jgi:hypothetical protein
MDDMHEDVQDIADILEMSRQTAEETIFLEAQEASRIAAMEDLYDDIANQMKDTMVHKPYARRRIIAVAGLDTVVLMGGDEHVRDVRDQIIADMFSDTPIEDDPLFAEAEQIMNEFGEDVLVARLMELHEQMTKMEEAEEEAKQVKTLTPEENRKLIAQKRLEFFEKRKIETPGPAHSLSTTRHIE